MTEARISFILANPTELIYDISMNHKYNLGRLLHPATSQYFEQTAVIGFDEY